MDRDVGPCREFGRVKEYFDPASYVMLGAVVALYVVRVIRHGGVRIFPSA